MFADIFALVLLVVEYNYEFQPIIQKFAFHQIENESEFSQAA